MNFNEIVFLILLIQTILVGIAGLTVIVHHFFLLSEKE